MRFSKEQPRQQAEYERNWNRTYHKRRLLVVDILLRALTVFLGLVLVLLFVYGFITIN